MPVDPPEKLALSADEISESSVRLSWHFLASLNEHPALMAASAPASKQTGNDLLDGYVLTFAKLGPNRKSSSSPHARQQGVSLAQHETGSLAKTAANSSSSGNNNSYSSAARISQTPPPPPSSHLQPHSHSLNPFGTVDGQWQAIQLAPQQRSHQLKNLDCGSSYSMKIWAFNKIGKGEPSDLLTVSTRGKGKC